MGQVCTVSGCHRTDVELHHWAPRCLFGEEEAELWPMSYLCRAHHSEWHRTTRTLAVKNHPDLYVESELLDRPVFIEPGVWASWSLGRRVQVADLVAGNPQVNFTDRTAFPVLDEVDWEGLCDSQGALRAFTRTFAYWARAVTVLTNAIPYWWELAS